MITKKLIVPAFVIVTAAGILTLSVPKIKAQTNDPMLGLVQTIAKKFNLDQTQVQNVVNQYRQQTKQGRSKDLTKSREDRLAQLVKDGKITETQRQAIVAELAALKTKYNPDNLKNLTESERETQVKDEESEIRAWAQTQGIELKLIMPQAGMGFHGGKHQTRPSPTPTK